MQKVRAIVYHEYGPPATVARLETLTLPELPPDGALVRLLAAPINPVDLNVIEGKYPIRPPLPGVPGVEGVGVVEEVGADVTHLRRGSMVLLPHGFGTWREAGVVPAAALVPVPDGIAPEQAAMFKINPPTALRMLRDFVDLPPGAWVLQNAANSGVGRAVIQLGRELGWRTANVVRRPELIAELQAAGAGAVLLDVESLPEELAKVTGGAPIPLALNAVGGESALRLANALAPGGTLVTYGAMSRQSLRVPNGLLIFKDLRWRGFWITSWYDHATVAMREAMFAELFGLAQRGVLHTPVERIFPIDHPAEALARAQEGGRSGKILLGFDPALLSTAG